MPFPYLSLPQLVQHEVLQNLGHIDHLFFSMISSKTRAIAKRSRKKVETIFWFFGGSCGNSISVQYLKDSNRSLKEPVWPDTRNLRPVKFNEEVVLWDSSDLHLLLGSPYLLEADKKKLFDQLNDLFFDVFKVRKCHFFGNIFRYKEFVSKYTKKLKGMIINCIDIQPELPDVLEEFGFEVLSVATPLASQTTSAPVISPIELSRPLKVKKLKCVDLKWLTMDAFWSIDCEKLSLHARCLRIDQLNELIKRWIAGGWRNLKEFKIRLWPTDADLVRIFEDIETEQNDDDSYRSEAF